MPSPQIYIIRLSITRGCHELQDLDELFVYLEGSLGH